MTPLPTLGHVLAPAFVQVLLCFVLLAGLVASRAAASRSPAAARLAGRVGASYSNQFEMPVLFFALVLTALAAAHADGTLVVLCWVFVAARLAQAAVHVTVNVIPLRGACFALGAAALLVGWVRLAWQVA